MICATSTLPTLARKEDTVKLLFSTVLNLASSSFYRRLSEPGWTYKRLPRFSAGLMGPVRIRHSSHNFGWQSSHSVDLAGWQAKMASIEIWIPWRNAHKPHLDLPFARVFSSFLVSFQSLLRCVVSFTTISSPWFTIEKLSTVLLLAPVVRHRLK